MRGQARQYGARGVASQDRVIPSGGAQRRRRGIAIVLVEGPPGRDECDSSPALGMTGTKPAR